MKRWFWTCLLAYPWIIVQERLYKNTVHYISSHYTGKKNWGNLGTFSHYNKCKKEDDKDSKESFVTLFQTYMNTIGDGLWTTSILIVNTDTDDDKIIKGQILTEYNFLSVTDIQISKICLSFTI